MFLIGALNVYVSLYMKDEGVGLVNECMKLRVIMKNVHYIMLSKCLCFVLKPLDYLNDARGNADPL